MTTDPIFDDGDVAQTPFSHRELATIQRGADALLEGARLYASLLDGRHPTAAGITIMTRAFFLALSALSQSEPRPNGEIEALLDVIFYRLRSDLLAQEPRS